MNKSTVIALAIMGLLLVKFGLGVIPPILILGLIVFIHEYGHYVFMVRNGVKVEEFTVGFGPTLFERKLASGTMFRIKLLLAGGYAKPVQTGEGSMDGCSSWAKFKIYMAGMFFNSCAAFVAYTVLFYWTWQGPQILVDLVRSWGTPRPLMPLAMAFSASFGFWLATPVIVVKMLLSGVGAFFAGTAGPVGIAQIGVAATGGAGLALKVQGMLHFFAMINVALAGMNLLPLMPLDGGRVVDLLLRKIPGKVGEVVVKYYTFATFVLIMLLIFGAIGMDFYRLLPKH